jgi:hypothetical protein
VKERLKKLARLRETWSQQKRATQYRMSSVLGKLTQMKTDKESLLNFHANNSEVSSLFPDVVMRKLIANGSQTLELNKELDLICSTYRQDSLNLKRCEILEQRQETACRQQDEAVALEVAIEAFLARKS